MTLSPERQRLPVSETMEQQYARELREQHAKNHPDGCPDWCKDCQARLTCKDGRHEWPPDYSDGDTCFCGALYLHANAIGERPHVIESR